MNKEHCLLQNTNISEEKKCSFKDNSNKCDKDHHRGSFQEQRINN